MKTIGRYFLNIGKKTQSAAHDSPHQPTNTCVSQVSKGQNQAMETSSTALEERLQGLLKDLHDEEWVSSVASRRKRRVDDAQNKNNDPPRCVVLPSLSNEDKIKGEVLAHWHEENFAGIGEHLLDHLVGVAGRHTSLVFMYNGAEDSDLSEIFTWGEFRMARIEQVYTLSSHQLADNSGHEAGNILGVPSLYGLVPRLVDALRGMGMEVDLRFGGVEGGYGWIRVNDAGSVFASRGNETDLFCAVRCRPQNSFEDYSVLLLVTLLEKAKIETLDLLAQEFLLSKPSQNNHEDFVGGDLLGFPGSHLALSRKPLIQTGKRVLRIARRVVSGLNEFRKLQFRARLPQQRVDEVKNLRDYLISGRRISFHMPKPRKTSKRSIKELASHSVDQFMNYGVKNTLMQGEVTRLRNKVHELEEKNRKYLRERDEARSQLQNRQMCFFPECKEDESQERHEQFKVKIEGSPTSPRSLTSPMSPGDNLENLMNHLHRHMAMWQVSSTMQIGQSLKGKMIQHSKNSFRDILPTVDQTDLKVFTQLHSSSNTHENAHENAQKEGKRYDEKEEDEESKCEEFNQVLLLAQIKQMQRLNQSLKGVILEQKRQMHILKVDARAHFKQRRRQQEDEKKTPERAIGELEMEYRASLRAQKAEHDAELEELRCALEKEKVLKLQSKELSHLETTLNQSERKEKDLHRKQQELEKVIASLQEENRAQKRKIQDLHSALDQRNAIFSAREQLLESYKNELANIRSKQQPKLRLHLELLERHGATVNTKMIEEHEEHKCKMNQLQFFMQKKDSLISGLNDQIHTHTTKNKDLLRKLKAKENEIHSLDLCLKKRHEVIASKEAQLNETRSLLDDAESCIEAQIGQIGELKQIADEFDESESGSGSASSPRKAARRKKRRSFLHVYISSDSSRIDDPSYLKEKLIEQDSILRSQRARIRVHEKVNDDLREEHFESLSRIRLQVVGTQAAAAANRRTLVRANKDALQRLIAKTEDLHHCKEDLKSAMLMLGGCQDELRALKDDRLHADSNEVIAIVDELAALRRKVQGTLSTREEFKEAEVEAAKLREAFQKIRLLQLRSERERIKHTTSRRALESKIEKLQVKIKSLRTKTSASSASEFLAASHVCSDLEPERKARIERILQDLRVTLTSLEPFLTF